jgi:hypothetical protein
MVGEKKALLCISPPPPKKRQQGVATSTTTHQAVRWRAGGAVGGGCGSKAPRRRALCGPRCAGDPHEKKDAPAFVVVDLCIIQCLLIHMFAARAGPEAEAEAGLDSKSAAAYERHHIRLRVVTGACRDDHGSIRARLLFIHSSTDDAAIQIDRAATKWRAAGASGAQPRRVPCLGRSWGRGTGHRLCGGSAPFCFRFV